MRGPRFLIYALQDPVTHEIRYIGRSSSGLTRPRNPHTGHCKRWVDKLAKEGLKPRVQVVQAFPPCPDVDAILNAAEIYWIAEFRRRGCPLTNLTAGGEGALGYRHTPAMRQILAARLQATVVTRGTAPRVRHPVRKSPTPTGAENTRKLHGRKLPRRCAVSVYRGRLVLKSLRR